MKVNEHLQKAHDNEKFLHEHSLIQTAFLDWAVTVISYTALHYVDALLANNFAFHPKDHRERSDRLYKTPALRTNLVYDFEDLKNDGIEARYTSRVFTSNEVENDILPLLEKIKGYVGQYVQIN